MQTLRVVSYTIQVNALVDDGEFLTPIPPDRLTVVVHARDWPDVVEMVTQVVTATQEKLNGSQLP